MKKILIFFLPIFMFFACDEIPPDVGMGTTDPPPGDVVQKALIEEFTGVRCVNCPAGSEAIEQLLSIHGERLIAVSIHAGLFANPFDESKYDFKIDDGVSLLSFLGQPLGFPTAVVGRKIFDGETEMQIAKGKWAGFIDQELAKEPIVSLELSGDVDESRSLTATVDVTFLDLPSSDETKITLMLTESNIKDYQETPEGKMSDYSHKHVLRAIITPFAGELIDHNVGVKMTKEFVYDIPDNWDLAEMQLIAFIHNSGDNKEIIQAESIDL